MAPVKFFHAVRGLLHGFGHYGILLTTKLTTFVPTDSMERAEITSWN